MGGYVRIIVGFPLPPSFKKGICEKIVPGIFAPRSLPHNCSRVGGVVKFFRFAPGLGIFFAPVYILKFLPYILAQRRRGGWLNFIVFLNL